MDYRKPHEDAAEAGAGRPRQVLARGQAPAIGGYSVSLRLESEIVASVDRSCLRITPAGGLDIELDNPGSPRVLLRSVSLDLTSFALELDADNLGPFTGAVVSLALEEAAALFLQPSGLVDAATSGGGSPVAIFLDTCPENDAGQREIWAYPLPLGMQVGLWLDPSSRVTTRVDSRGAALELTTPLYLRAPLLALAIVSVRFEFGGGRLEIKRVGEGIGWFSRFWGAVLLWVAVRVARRWIAKRLPPAMRREAYDLYDDPDRLQTLQALFARLRGGPRGDSGVEEEGSGRRAQLQELVKSLSGREAPAGSWLVARAPVGDGRELAVCLDEGVELEVTRSDRAVEIATRGGSGRGLFVHVDGHPRLASIRLEGLRLGLDPDSLSLVTYPEMGPFEQSLVQQVFQTLVAPRIPPVARMALNPALGLASDADRVRTYRRYFGEGEERGVVVSAAREATVSARLAAAEVMVELSSPVKVETLGMGALPEFELSRIRYDRGTGDIKVTATPALGALELAVIDGIVRHQVAPRVPEALGVHGPKEQPEEDTPRAVGRSHGHLLHARGTPIGSVVARMASDDRLAVTASAGRVRVTSVAGVVVLVPGIGLTLRVEGASVDMTRGSVDLLCDPPVGPLVRAFASAAFLSRAAPLVVGRVPPLPDRPAEEPWVLARTGEITMLGVVTVALAARGHVSVERRADGLFVRAVPGVAITPANTWPVQGFAFKGLRWELPADRWTLVTEPPVGDIVQVALARAVSKFAPPTLYETSRRLGLPAIDESARPPASPPPLRGPRVWQRELPRIGVVDVSLPPEHQLGIELNRRAARITLGDGVIVRVSGLAFHVRIKGVTLHFDPWSIEYEVEPGLGALERGVLDGLIAGILREHARRFWPANEPCPPGHETLLVLGRDEPWGPVRFSVPKGGSISVGISTTGVAVASKAGVLMHTSRTEWLPDFSLHRLLYAFSTGAVSIDISGIEQRYYVEEDDVSPVTEEILAHLIKLKGEPRIPDQAALIGFVRHDPPPEIRPPFGRVKLFNTYVSPQVGVFTLSMDPDDIITVQVSDEEVSLNCTLGLMIHLPDLRLQLEIRHIRYHPKSGEVQVDRFGQLENALIEAVIERQYKKQQAKRGKVALDGQTPVSEFLDNLPRDDKERYHLVDTKYVELYLAPEPKFAVKFGSEGLEFHARPPIQVDGPSIADVELDGVRYNFTDSSFNIVLADDGVLPDFISDLAIGRIEQALAKKLTPLLPPIMREPGYTLADDIDPADTLSALIAGLMAFKRK